MAQPARETVAEKRPDSPGVERLLWSSADSPWRGFPLQRRAERTHTVEHLYCPETSVVLVTHGGATVTERGVGTFVAPKGSINIWPAGYELELAAAVGDYEVVCVGLDPAMLARLLPGVELSIEAGVGPRRALRDPSLASLVRLMAAAVEAGCPMGGLYDESLSAALAAYVAGHYARSESEPRRRAGGLSGPQLRRVLEYIRADLGRDLTVAQLADVAGASRAHFCRAFRASVGVAPHRYVLRERVREAERLLAARRMSIAEVASSLGFAHQSHFTLRFRLATGTTPRAYLRAR